MISRSFYLTDWQIEKLEEIRVESQVPTSAFVRQAITAAIHEHEAKEAKRKRGEP